MGALTAGSVVLVDFPFSDLSQTKRRPAVVLADAGGGDWIVCQVTSQAYADPRAIKITNADFQRGTLSRESYARASKLFTAHHSLLIREVGLLKTPSLEALTDLAAAILKGTA